MARNKYLLAGLLPALYLVALTSRVAFAVPEQTPEFIRTQIANPELVGQGEYRRFLWRVYDAGLYASHGAYVPEKNFALLLEYKRDLSGSAIVDKSIELIEAQGVDDRDKLEKWHAFLQHVIPDVQEGDQIIGISTDSASYFYFNGELLGQTTDSGFRHYFFSIWLGENTTAPDLRRELIGPYSADNQE